MSLPVKTADLCPKCGGLLIRQRLYTNGEAQVMYEDYCIAHGSFPPVVVNEEIIRPDIKPRLSYLYKKQHNIDQVLEALGECGRTRRELLGLLPDLSYMQIHHCINHLRIHGKIRMIGHGVWARVKGEG